MTWLRLGRIDAGIGELCCAFGLMSMFLDDAQTLPYMVMFGDPDWATPQHFGGHFCRAFSPRKFIALPSTNRVTVLLLRVEDYSRSGRIELGSG